MSEFMLLQANQQALLGGVSIPKRLKALLEVHTAGIFRGKLPHVDEILLLAHGSCDGPRYPQTPDRGEFTRGISISSPHS